MLSSEKHKGHQISFEVLGFFKKTKLNFRIIEYYQTKTFPKNKWLYTKGEMKQPPKPPGDK